MNQYIICCGREEFSSEHSQGVKNIYGVIPVDESTVSRRVSPTAVSEECQAEPSDARHALRPSTAVTQALLQVADEQRLPPNYDQKACNSAVRIQWKCEHHY